MEHDAETILRAEVVDLHRFFVRWYAGTAAPSEVAAVVARFREDFGYIYPGGSRSSRDDLAAMFAASHGANPDFRIQVTAFSFQALLVTSDVALWGVTYEEYQAGARNSAADNGRLSSAIFEVRGGAACWVHLHECWLPQPQVAEHHNNYGPLVQYGLPVAADDLPAIRADLDARIALEAGRQGDGNTLWMRTLCAQLFCAGAVEDILRIWRAKQASFDAACSIDAELLCGPGLDETLGHLSAQTDPQATAVLKYLRQCEPELEGYRESLLAHYA